MRAYKQKITNSSTYNNSLEQRRRLDLWIDKSIFSNCTYSGKQSRGEACCVGTFTLEFVIFNRIQNLRPILKINTLELWQKNNWIHQQQYQMLGDNLDFVIEKVSDFETVWKGVLSLLILVQKEYKTLCFNLLILKKVYHESLPCGHKKRVLLS